MRETVKTGLFLATRYIRRGNKSVTIVTIALLALVFLQLVFVSSLIGGVTERFNELLIEYQTGDMLIEAKEDHELIRNSDAQMSRILSLPQVWGASARLKTSGQASSDDESKGLTIYGVDPEREATVTSIDQAILSGYPLSKLDHDEIILGREITGGFDAVQQSTSLGDVKVGDTVTIRVGGTRKEFRVKGIYSTGYFKADASGYMHKETLRDMLKAPGNTAHEIAVSLKKGEDIEEMKHRLASMGVDGQIHGWRQYAGLLAMVTGTLSMIGYLLNLIGLVVAFVIIFVVIYVNINSKTRQIGVQKAIGIDERAIILSFVFQAIFFAACGMLLGVLGMQFGITPLTESHPLILPVGAVTLILSMKEGLIKAGLLFSATVLAAVIPVYKLVNRSILQLIWG